MESAWVWEEVVEWVVGWVWVWVVVVEEAMEGEEGDAEWSSSAKLAFRTHETDVALSDGRLCSH